MLLGYDENGHCPMLFDGKCSIRDRGQHSAAQSAEMFLRERAEYFPSGVIPSNTTQLAILTIKVYDVFFKHKDKAGKTRRVSPDLEVAKAVTRANEKFEAKHDTLKFRAT